MANTRTVHIDSPYVPISYAERQRVESFPLLPVNFLPYKSGGSPSVLLTSSWNIGITGQLTFIGQRYNSANAVANQIMKVYTNGNRVVTATGITFTVTSAFAAGTIIPILYSTLFGSSTYNVVTGTTVTLPMPDVRGGDTLVIYLGTPTGGASDTTAVTVVASFVNGYDMTDDERPGIQYIQREIGDSLTNGTGLPSTSDSFLHVLNQYWLARGFPMRRDNHGEYGKTTDFIVLRMQASRYNANIQNVRLLTYMIGTNDANISTVITTAALDTLQQNITNMFLWRKAFCPWTIFLMIAPPPVGNLYQTTYGLPNVESNLALIRTRIRTAVTLWQAANPSDLLLRFIDLSGTAGDPLFPTPLIDKSVNANYSDGLHINRTGSGLIANVIPNYFELAANKAVLVPAA